VSARLTDFSKHTLGFTRKGSVKDKGLFCNVTVALFSRCKWVKPGSGFAQLRPLAPCLSKLADELHLAHKARKSACATAGTSELQPDRSNAPFLPFMEFLVTDPSHCWNFGDVPHSFAFCISVEFALGNAQHSSTGHARPYFAHVTSISEVQFDKIA